MNENTKDNPFVVPPFSPPAQKPPYYAWWSWHPNYPYWSKSCWGSEDLEEAREYINKVWYELELYHNKLIKEHSGAYEEIEDVPCARLDIWRKIKNQNEVQSSRRLSRQ